MRSRLNCVFLILAFGCVTAEADIFVPGETVPGATEIFTWAENHADSTWAFWDTFERFPGGAIPGGIVPGTSPEANSSFAGQASGTTSLTFDSFATIVSSGNAYGFNFAPGLPPVQPEFITDAYTTIRAGDSGGDFTRIVAQWQTQGTELDYDTLLLSLDGGQEGTIVPDFTMETGRVTLGGFGGELVNRIAVWDVDSSADPFRVDFRAQANHMSFDQFRIDTFTQASTFNAITAIPEPGSLFAMSLVTGGLLLRRRRV
ncbi:MAG: PEP-CTERM sorting domain-containing protein [Planctomycetota bacterium]